MNKLIQFWGDLRSSFWFMPSLMVAGSIAFTVVLIEIDIVCTGLVIRAEFTDQSQRIRIQNGDPVVTFNTHTD